MRAVLALLLLAALQGASAQCSRVLPGGAECKWTPGCCKSGSCYQKDAHYAECRESCSAAGWTCKVLGAAAPAAAGSCAEMAACTNTPACCSAGLVCAEMTQFYAVCLKNCPARSGWLCDTPPPAPPLSDPSAPALLQKAQAGPYVAVTIEEGSTGFCASDGRTEAEHAGSTGGGYTNVVNAVGSSVLYAVTASAATTAVATVRFANGGSAARAATLTVHSTSKLMAFASTGAWDRWASEHVSVDLDAGMNILILAAATDDGLANVDNVEIAGVGLTPGPCVLVGPPPPVPGPAPVPAPGPAPVPAPGPAPVPAPGPAPVPAPGPAPVPPVQTGAGSVVLQENGGGFCVVDGVVEAAGAGFSGAGYVNFDDRTGAGVLYNVSAAAAGAATVSIRYANGATTALTGSLTIASEWYPVNLAPSGSWTSWSTAWLSVQLVQGANELILVSTGSAGLANIDFVQISGAGLSAGDCTLATPVPVPMPVPTPTSPPAPTPTIPGVTEITIQPNAAGYCFGDGVVQHEHAGYTGIGYFSVPNVHGASLSFEITAAVATSTTITLRYANAGPQDHPTTASIHSVSHAMRMEPTGSWDSWKTATVTALLVPGDNMLVVAASSAQGLPNIDSVSFAAPGISVGDCVAGPALPPPLPAPGSVVLQEGSDGYCISTGVVESAHAGYTGPGYTRTENRVGGSILYGVTASAPASARVTVRYANGGTSDHPATLSVYSGLRSIWMPSTGSNAVWKEVTVTVPLAAGSNMLVLSAASAAGLPNIDFISFLGAGVSAMHCVP
ncbi:Alpha-L-arabinofuranosidase C [Diplonema papillatum]|nr:Alpha-L-arabinofuranosidase C [Diplonema papillatum]